MPEQYERRATPLRAVRRSVHLLGEAAARAGRTTDRIEASLTNRLDRFVTSRNTIDFRQLIDIPFPALRPIYPVLPAIGQRPSVNVFCFLHEGDFYGGVATLMLVAAKLAMTLDYDLRAVQTRPSEAKEIKPVDVCAYLESQGVPFPRERYSTIDLSGPGHRLLPLHPDDVVIASAWWDARTAAPLPLRRPFVYLIQDFEPLFYSNSDPQLWSEATYRGDRFVPLLNSSMLKEFFVTRRYESIGPDAVSFEPAVGLQPVAEAPAATGGHKTLFLYARPKVERNLFYTSLQALDIAFSDPRVKAEDWWLVSAGMDGFPDIVLSNGVTIHSLGKLPYDGYRRLVRQVDVAVTPMLSPHPNYPTLEFASVGARVVTTAYETKTDLSRYSPGIVLTQPTAAALGAAIVDATMSTAHHKPPNHVGHDWNAALDEPIRQVAHRL